MATLPPGSTDTHAHVMRSDVPSSVPGARYHAHHAPVDRYLALLDELGLQRGVLVTPSTYGTDNAVLVDALRQAPARLRGIAVVPPDCDPDTLAALHEAESVAAGCRTGFPAGSTCMPCRTSRGGWPALAGPSRSGPMCAHILTGCHRPWPRRPRLSCSTISASCPQPRPPMRHRCANYSRWCGVGGALWRAPARSRRHRSCGGEVTAPQSGSALRAGAGQADLGKRLALRRAAGSDTYRRRPSPGTGLLASRGTPPAESW